ncbi:hypothetical protein LTR62_001125 [Meristemomyces frigidus]|uniref:Rab-GAP TBC domain-containing protein n=1 Tax=Meristemomyces frigidus TaxID=1508187 RepID=A0AAN7TSY1_9PEZI|nr:hypothetical protein LTR62_001125 [Meristemomyces frigidus]
MAHTVEQRLQPSHGSSGLLRTLRYEDTSDGKPPVQVRSISPPPLSPGAAHRQDPDATTRRAPSASSRTAELTDDELKRDSGIASSVGHASNAEVPQSPTRAGLGDTRGPTLPTIVVQDADSTSPIEQSRSPFRRKKSKESVRAMTPKDPGLQRIRSFKGIQADIPSGGFDEIAFEDLASDKVGFSHRGSLLFGGKKMNDLIMAQGDGTVHSSGMVRPIRPAQTPMARQETAENQAGAEVVPESPKKGLVSGRRTPSVHLLQSALDGGRVLSAEEITFSMRVRSMYEHGDERAADWVQPLNMDLLNGKVEGKDELSGRISPGPGASASNDHHHALGQEILRPSTVQTMRSTYTRDENELAGGIEDWDEIQKQDVDRYGFISPSQDNSRPSTTGGRPRESVHRVATALRLEAETPRRNRRLRRGHSNARSARSVPPRPSEDATMKQPPGSMHSFRTSKSAQSSTGSFFSKDRKLLAVAADMLTLPPGLSDIAEQDDNGSVLSANRKREWARDEKWQKMARPVRERSGSKGGGMRFDFDTTDPKLIDRTWKGIPDRWRATAWHSFLSASARRRGDHVPDERLVEEFHNMQELSSADDVQIDVDVPRTINMHIMFRRRYRGGQRLLFRILHAISLYCPEPGYVQGMASLAATLLCYYDEERAFVMMVRLWQLRGLRQLFQSEFVGLIAALDEFEREWLRGGDVAQKLEELGIPSTSYGTRWYLTLFNLSVPFPAQLRIWDVFMLLGDAPLGVLTPFGGADLDVLHATSAALIDATREILVEADFETVMKVLTSFIPIKDEDLLMRIARTEWKMRKKRAGVRS